MTKNRKPVKKLPDHIVDDLYMEYLSLPDSDRRKYINRTAIQFNIHPTQLRRKFAKKSIDVTISHRVDKGKARLMADDKKKEHVIKVAGFMRLVASSTGTCTTLEAQEALIKLGQLDRLVAKSTMDRWLREFGLSQRYFLDPGKSVHLGAEYPNDWWLIDFTVSEQYYLRHMDGRIIRDTEIAKDKNHTDEHLHNKGYQKIIFGCIIDMYSKAFFFKYYMAPAESTDIFLDLLKSAMMIKKNGIYGRPANLYGDRSKSVYKNNRFFSYLFHLNINMKFHYPKRPKAKGGVERRIGLIKDKFERLQLRIIPASNIDELNNRALIWMANEMNKTIDGEHSILSLWGSIPNERLIILTEEQMDEANYKYYSRKLNAFHVVSFTHKGVSRYFQLEDHCLQVGQKLEIFDTLSGVHARTVDGKIYRNLKEVQDQYGETRIMDGTGKRNPSTIHSSHRLEAEAAKRDLKTMLNNMQPEELLEKYRPTESNVTAFPKRGIAAMDIIPPDVRQIKDCFSIAEAHLAIAMLIGQSLDTLPEMITSQTNDMLAYPLNYGNGIIPGSLIQTIANTIADYLTSQRQQKFS